MKAINREEAAESGSELSETIVKLKTVGDGLTNDRRD